MAEKQSVLNNPKKLIKGIAFIVGLLIMIVLFKNIMSPSKADVSQKQNKPQTPLSSRDTASSDTSNETVQALAAQIQSVSDQNKHIMAQNNKVIEDNRQAKVDTEQKIQGALQQIDLKAQQIQNAAPKPKPSTTNGSYPVGDNHDGVLANGAQDHLMWVDDMQGGLESAKNISSAQSDFSISSQQSTSTLLIEKNAQAKPKPIPRYTIPVNSTLFDSVTWTGLIGRIPINGVVRDPYPFKVIIGHKDFAANGINIPDIQGVIVGGYAVGDLGMGCVRGNITSLTFVFQDGRISTQQVTGTDGSDSKLGYLSTPTGNPCINGTYYGNAPAYLAGTVALGAAQGAAGAFAQAQTTSNTNIFGGSTTTLTGSPWKYVMGQSGVNGAAAASQWWTQREQNSFDAIFVPSCQPVAVNITQEIPIDYDPNGRKVAYDLSKTNVVTRALD